MSASALTWLSYGLVLAGMVFLSVAVYGLVRMPSIYLKLHAASLTAVGGVIPILIGLALLSGEAVMITRTIALGIFLLLTVPVAAQAMASAAHHGGEPLQESDKGLGSRGVPSGS